MIIKKQKWSLVIKVYKLIIENYRMERNVFLGIIL